MSIAMKTAYMTDDVSGRNSMRRDIVVVITGNSYPEGDAGAVRQHVFCKVLQQMGYSPLVIGMGKATKFRDEEYDGIRYYSLRYSSSHIAMRILGRMAFGMNLQRIMKTIDPASIAGIIVVSGGSSVFRWIEDYGCRNSIPLYHDSVEWYSPEEFTLGKFDAEYRAKDHLNRRIIRGKWRVIAISRYLEEHFRKQCIDVIRVPVIMDVSKFQCRTDVNCSSPKVRFAYVGAPAKKDFLAETIRGFSMLPRESMDRIELHIVGVNKEKLINMCGADERCIAALGESLMIHGRLPRKEALQMVADADYTLLLRDETLRYAKAGFPTKIVESLAHGTPPVCNLSSDLDEYLKDGENSFIIPGHTAQDVRETIIRIIDRHPQIGSSMRTNARKTAEECFDAKNYVKAFGSFFDE